MHGGVNALVLAVVMVACGGAPASPTTAPSPPPAVAAQPAKQWWCYTLDGQLGSCFDQAVACQAARTMMVNSAKNPAEKLSECAAQPRAVCFSLGDKQMCHPTLAMCRGHADFERREGKAVGDCASTDSAAASDPNWWCLSFGGGRIGSCARSKDRCEQDRAKAIELQQGGPVDVTPCTSQASSYCFGGAALCHPTLETCQSALSYANKNGRNTGEDCEATQ
jgi:hypothetical protein